MTLRRCGLPGWLPRIDTSVPHSYICVMPTTTVRERQLDLARTAIFDAVRRHLEDGDADQISMDDLATEAGVSRRTLYRYFPNRDALVAATGTWIRDDVLQLPIEIGPAGIAASFRAAAARLNENPRLARALLRTDTGRAVRAGYRSERVEAIRTALRRDVPGLSGRALDRAAAVLGYLCSSNAWITIQDDAGIDASSAQAAVTWAIEALLAQLRETTHSPSSRSSSRKGRR